MRLVAFGTLNAHATPSPHPVHRRVRKVLAQAVAAKHVGAGQAYRIGDLPVFVEADGALEAVGHIAQPRLPQRDHVWGDSVSRPVSDATRRALPMQAALPVRSWSTQCSAHLRIVTSRQVQVGGLQ